MPWDLRLLPCIVSWFDTLWCTNMASPVMPGTQRMCSCCLHRINAILPTEPNYLRTIYFAPDGAMHLMVSICLAGLQFSAYEFGLLSVHVILLTSRRVLSIASRVSISHNDLRAYFHQYTYVVIVSCLRFIALFPRGPHRHVLRPACRTAGLPRLVPQLRVLRLLLHPDMNPATLWRCSKVAVLLERLDWLR